MSLDVPAALLAKAEHGPVTDEEFVDVVRTSLPYAWQVISSVACEVNGTVNGTVNGIVNGIVNGTVPFAVHAVPPPSEAERGQLLRALASDAIRGGLERHFGVRLAFQNCHRVAAFGLSAVNGAAYRDFVSPRGQLRNQTPALRDC